MEAIARFARVVSQVLCASILLASGTAVAQTAQDTSRSEAAFRQRVVSAMKWRPEQGVALTTTAYARQYLQRYFDEAGVWKTDGPTKISLHGDLDEGAMVLFQTDTHDILVADLRYMEGPKLLVIERRSGELVVNEGKYSSCHMVGTRFEFVDVDGEAPLELARSGTISCATSAVTDYFHAYDLSTGFEPMLELDYYVDLKKCPRLNTRFADSSHYKPTKRRGETFQFVFQVEKWVQLYDEHDCWRPESSSAPRNRLSCEYESEARRFSCQAIPTRRSLLSLEDVKLGATWRRAAVNIRWVLEHADEMEAVGYRFPNGFLERLPRHLPEGR